MATGEFQEVPRLTMAECKPADLDVLDEYQQAVIGQVQFDEDGQHVRGYDPEIYMYLGMREEFRETFGDDQYHPEYHRLGALLSIIEGGTAKTIPGEVTPKALEYHRKEFGDVSWYVANFLALYNITMSAAVTEGEVAWNEDSQNEPKCDVDFCLETERSFPLFNYAGYMHELTVATEDILRGPTDKAIGNLAPVAGKFILSMAHVTKSRLGVSYEEVLAGNIAKINKRIADGTVYDKTLGDAR